ncbi:MAG: hypothetical protein HPY50_12260 [Firmicutes bacterium]|nr:hypothetical protein [Bacillota bacterium]
MSGIRFFRIRTLLGLMLVSALASAAWFGLQGFKLPDFKPPKVDDLAAKVASYSTAGSKLILGRPLISPVITQDTAVVREYHYKWCGHTESGVTTRDPLLVGLTLEQINRLYPASEGWEVNFDQPSRLLLRLNLEQLCQVDSHKRHLGEVNDRVAIFIGPAGYSGALEKITQIPMEKLPPEWQETIRQGTLEFIDSETLSQALDNLDEYY